LEFGRDFRILHYAGEVTYCVLSFIDKNKDTLFQDFKRLLYNRSVQLSQLFNWKRREISNLGWVIVLPPGENNFIQLLCLSYAMFKNFWILMINQIVTKI